MPKRLVRKLKVRPKAASCHLIRRRGCGYLAAVVVPVSLMVWSHSRPADLSAGWEYCRRKRVLDLARTDAGRDLQLVDVQSGGACLDDVQRVAVDGFGDGLHCVVLLGEEAGWSPEQMTPALAAGLVLLLVHGPRAGYTSGRVRGALDRFSPRGGPGPPPLTATTSVPLPGYSLPPLGRPSVFHALGVSKASIMGV